LNFFNLVVLKQIIDTIKTSSVLEYSDNLSSLGTPGTRQTLYLSGEENVSLYIYLNYYYFCEYTLKNA